MGSIQTGVRPTTEQRRTIHSYNHNMAGIGEGIYTEQQLLAAIEADQWCDSDGESSVENDETDYGLRITNTHGQYEGVRM